MSKGLFDCSGKVTLVTGGNGGIGLGFATGIAKMGGDIAIWARNAEKNAAAKEALLAAGAARVETYIVDVSSEEAILAGYDQLMADFGRIDCVFANSGASPRYKSIFDMPTEHWHDFQKTALHGAFFTLREAARHMKARAEAGEPGGNGDLHHTHHRDGNHHDHSPVTAPLHWPPQQKTRLGGFFVGMRCMRLSPAATSTFPCRARRSRCAGS